MRKTILAMAMLLVSSAIAIADSYPSRPLTLIVAFATGGPADANGRAVAEAAAKALAEWRESEQEHVVATYQFRPPATTT